MPPWAAARPRAAHAAGCCLWRRWCSGRRMCFVRPGCLMPRGRRPAREPKGSEWSISKPARALRTLRHPPHRRCLCCWCVAWCVVSMPGQALPPPTGAAARPCRRPPAPRPGPLVPPAPHTSVAVGVLRHAKPSDGVSPACRSFGWRHSPVWWLWGRESRGVAAKLQTHWVKNAGNRLFWLNGSALWRNLWVWMHRLRYPAL